MRYNETLRKYQSEMTELPVLFDVGKCLSTIILVHNVPSVMGNAKPTYFVVGGLIFKRSVYKNSLHIHSLTCFERRLNFLLYI